MWSLLLQNNREVFIPLRSGLENIGPVASSQGPKERGWV